MTKHKILDREEQKNYQPIGEYLDLINNYISSLSLNKKKVKILDWGCGRGQMVLYLKEQGFTVFGVDTDSLPLKNGIPLFKIMGYSSIALSKIKNNGKINFKDDYFDIVISNQVFEHISSIDFVLDEISRITKSKGIGLHIFPAHKNFVEPHLNMPLIHWFPKNVFRKLMIYIFVLLKIEPNWEELNKQSIKMKAKHYYDYSVNKTFYRSHRKVIKLFKARGFESLTNYGLNNYRNNIFQIIGNTLRNLFFTTKLIVRKK